MVQSKKRSAAIAAAFMAMLLGASGAAAEPSSPMIGFWTCSGQTDTGLTIEATFDYRADGIYDSTQIITLGAERLEGRGGGTWRLENGILHDTKQRATLERYLRAGVEVPQSDPQWQALYAQSQANIGVTSSGEIRIDGNVAYSSLYTCRRQPR